MDKNIHLVASHSFIDYNEGKERTSVQCSICGVSFRRRLTLEQHIETVHEQKQYQCETCFEFFKSKYTLKLHIEFEHEGKEMLECPTCNKQFKAKKSLEKHISFVHQKESQTTYLCPGHIVPKVLFAHP